MSGLIIICILIIGFALAFTKLCADDKKKTDWLILNGEVSRNFLPRGTRVMICGARVSNQRILGRVGVVLGGVGGNLSVLYKIDGERIEEILPRKDIIYCIRVYSNEMLRAEIDGHAAGWWEDPMKHGKEDNDAE